MFEIGFPELVVISIIALLVLGPERLPEALRTMGLWFGRLRRSFTAVKTEIEKEIGMDDIRRQLHNEAIMEEMERIEAEVNSSMDPDSPEPSSTNDVSAHETASSENSIAPPTSTTQPADGGVVPATTDGAEFANEPLAATPDSASEPTEKTNRADNA